MTKNKVTDKRRAVRVTDSKLKTMKEFVGNYDEVVKNPGGADAKKLMAVLDVVCRYHKENNENGKQGG